jgi:DeoR/GlpR family transcriptional regulator of sugar metabolism
MRAQAVQDMAAQAEKVVVLTESEKFNRHGTVPLNLKNGVSQVITDASIQPEAAEALRSAGVEITTV